MPVWCMVVLVAGGSFGGGYLLSRHFQKRSHLKPSYRGLLLGAVTFLGVFLLQFVLKTFGIELFRGTANKVFQSVLVLVLLSIPARIFFIRHQSGPELVDLGPNPLRPLIVSFGSLLVLVAIAGMITRSFHFGQAVVSLAQGICLLALGLVRSEIRGDGISYAGGLLRWNRIAGFEWSQNVLMIDLRRPRWWQDRVQLPVAPVLVNQVDELMRQHVAGVA